MSAISYCFEINDDQIPVNMNLGIFKALPEKIQSEFLSSHTYKLLSNVKKENAEFFISYFICKNQEPVFNIENITDFYALSKELEINELTTKIDEEYGDILRTSFLKKATGTQLSDISDSEKYISLHLDAFLLRYTNEMYSIPFSSLYNIFFDKNRKLDNENLGYQFITHKLKTRNDNDNDTDNDDSLFILLQSLNSKNLTEEAMRDCISNRDEHLGFIPQIDFSYFDNFAIKVADIESKVAQIQEENQRLVEELKSQKEKMVEKETLKGLIESALHIGCKFGYTELVKYILELGDEGINNSKDILFLHYYEIFIQNVMMFRFYISRNFVYFS